MTDQPNYLMTIAIPTYNRAQYLDQNLAQIQKQWSDTENLVELIVSNNCSPDNTDEIVQKYLKSGLPIRYNKNPENIGTKNIELCFRLAAGKYVVVFADDEVFVDGALKAIINFIKNEDFGVVYLTGYGYDKDWKRPAKRRPKFRLHTYNNLTKFVKRINYFFTFISGNLVNKSMVDPNDIMPFPAGANVHQMSWVFSALFKSKKNAVIEGGLIACKGEPGGSYHLAQIFGVNANEIFHKFIARGINIKYFKIINRRLLSEFFPGWIIQIRQRKKIFHQEDYHKVLYPVFKDYPEYWLWTYPIIAWPLPLARFWFKIVEALPKPKRI
jgi:glycosyltransferase involved in cell wall biosynthesis